MIRQVFGFALMVALLCGCHHKSSDSPKAISHNLLAAHDAIERGDSSFAIDLYRQIITTISDSSAYAEIAPSVIEAMDRLTDIQRHSSQKTGAIQWFEELKNHPTSLIRSTVWRDLHTYLAMLYFNADSIAKAEQYMAAALELPMIGGDTDDRYYRDYVQASRIFIGNGQRRPEIPGWLEKALKHAEHCDSLPDLSYTRSMLGTLYFWEGRIGDAFAMMNDNLNDVEAKNDTLGMIMALNTLTNLHNSFRLNKIANTYASRSIALAEKARLNNTVTISDAYMLKIGAVADISPDSVMYYVAKAEDNCRNRSYNMGQEDIDYAAANHLIWRMHQDTIISDSVKKQMRDEAEMRLWRYVKNVAPIKRAGAFNLLSHLYLDENVHKAEAMLDSTYCYQHLVEGIPMLSKDIALFAIAHYAKTGNTNKLIQYVNDLIESNALENDKDTEQQLVQNIIDLRIAHANDAVKQLQLEVKLRQSYIVLIVVFTVAVLMMLLVLFLLYRRRQTRKAQKLNREKFKLERQLSSEMEKTSNTKKELDDLVSDLDSRRAIELLTPDILKERGETEFRKRFHLLYPAFNNSLTEQGFTLSRREEIMCMLIVLGRNNQEIADILNIEKKSVNVARYRLRQKLKLAEEINLDEFLKSCCE